MVAERRDGTGHCMWGTHMHSVQPVQPSVQPCPTSNRGVARTRLTCPTFSSLARIRCKSTAHRTAMRDRNTLDRLDRLDEASNGAASRRPTSCPTSEGWTVPRESIGAGRRALNLNGAANARVLPDTFRLRVIRTPLFVHLPIPRLVPAVVWGSA